MSVFFAMTKQIINFIINHLNSLLEITERV